jgi:hypothetical protein
VDLDEILFGDDDIDSIMFNPVASPFKNGGCLNF